MTYTDLKPIADAIPCIGENINEQASNILRIITGEEAEFQLTPGPSAIAAAVSGFTPASRTSQLSIFIAAGAFADWTQYCRFFTSDGQETQIHIGDSFYLKNQRTGEVVACKWGTLGSVPKFEQTIEWPSIMESNDIIFIYSDPECLHQLFIMMDGSIGLKGTYYALKAPGFVLGYVHNAALDTVLAVYNYVDPVCFRIS